MLSGAYLEPHRRDENNSTSPLHRRPKQVIQQEQHELMTSGGHGEHLDYAISELNQQRHEASTAAAAVAAR